MAKGNNFFQLLLIAVAGFIAFTIFSKQTRITTPANAAKTVSQTTADKSTTGEFGVTASKVLDQLKNQMDTPLLQRQVTSSGGTNQTIQQVIDNTPPFVVKTSESRPITTAEKRLITDLAFTFPHNFFVQDLARRANNNGTITNSDIKILSLNPETRVLSTMLTPIGAMA